MKSLFFRLPSAGLALAALLVFSVLLPSCNTYHKVAVWYKYRKDFRLSEERAPAPRTAARAAPEVAAAPAPTFRSDGNAQSEGMFKKPREEIRLKVSKAKGNNLLALDPHATAAAPGQILVDHRPVWERMKSLAPEHVLQAANRPRHWAGTTGLILAGAALLIALVFYRGPFLLLLVVAAGLISLIGLIRSGPRKKYQGRGIALAGLLLSLLALLVLVALLLA